jgi:SgrR family transcriptional regulator
MRIFEDYLTIRKAFPMKTGDPFPVSMAELAALLYCSQRNVKNILMKMEERQWLNLTPGKGRGHMSEITFLLSTETIMQREAEMLVKEGNITGALKFLKNYGDEQALSKQFLQWLSNYFGVSVKDEMDTLKLPIYRVINTIDPAEAYYALDSHLVTQVYDTLVKYNADTKEIEPSLSHFWEVNETGTEWTFYLRKRVSFHHGKEFTALDVQYSLERLRDVTKHWIAASITKVAVSRYKVEIELEQPNHLFLYFLTYAPFSIKSDDGTHYGTGPYKVISQNEDSCILEANDHYFSERPLMDRIEILRVPDITGFEPKFNSLMVNTGEAEESRISHWEETEIISGTNILTINTKKPGPLKDRSFRKALYHLINREELGKELGGPRHNPAHSFQLAKCFEIEDCEFRPEEGINLLRDSSHNKETLHLYTYERHAPDAYWLQKKYRQYGIDMEVHILPWNELLNPSITEKADFILFEVVLSEGIMRLIEAYLSPGGFIKSHLDESLSFEVERKVQQAISHSSITTIEQELMEIENLIKKQYGVIFLNYKSVSTLSHLSLQQVKVNGKGWVDFSKIWFKQ